ncbi:adenylate/guanylate cyclase domain-containing protein [Occallatibacter riparius]|uniref:Response regulator n=1 Tax=Occallatibacter riparius TaxID=1002689 RepID=A0A9J7BSZ6_9BACT|nr:adenylate/guanylate cyclase domain-containing protein [Occallatibacter riparius]UWZ84874.1 response regulator [Occallatibacter riparius]
MTSSDDKKTILLVDDAPANIEVAREILKGVFRTRIATSGAKALESVKVSPAPDLILLDVKMPEMDGYEVCRRLKLDPATREIPVIFLTAMTEAADETKGFDMGAVDYIHKPFSPPVVLARVQTHLNLRETREQLAREKQLVDRLLDNILPPAAVKELKTTGKVAPQRFENVAVLFVDLVSFTAFCDRHAPEEVVSALSDLFLMFEETASRYGLEKIKTIGDAFLATAGLLNPVAEPLRAAVSCALDIVAATPHIRDGWRVHAGVHLGPVMAGIVGRERYQFDVWGDTVNVAARLTSAASPNSVVLTESHAALLSGLTIAPRGKVELKGKGLVPLVEISASALFPVTTQLA